MASFLNPATFFVAHFCTFQVCSMSHLLYGAQTELKGSMKELNKFYIYETEKITHKASDAAEYIKLFGNFGSFTRNHHARCI